VERESDVPETDFNFSAIFLGTESSTFSADIERMRTGLGTRIVGTPFAQADVSPAETLGYSMCRLYCDQTILQYCTVLYCTVLYYIVLYYLKLL